MNNQAMLGKWNRIRERTRRAWDKAAGRNRHDSDAGIDRGATRDSSDANARQHSNGGDHDEVARTVARNRPRW